MIQPTSESVCVPARISSLPQLLAMLSTQPHAPDQVPPFLRAQLAVEELFVNTIRHGYGQESDHPVWLTVEQDGTVLRVVYADQADAFDPLSPNFSTGRRRRSDQVRTQGRRAWPPVDHQPCPTRSLHTRGRSQCHAAGICLGSRDGT